MSVPEDCESDRRGVVLVVCRGDDLQREFLLHSEGVIKHLPSVHQIERTHPRLGDEAYRAIVGEGGLRLLTSLLGRDDDYAIRRTSTVDGGGCGVLQHGDVLDRRRIDCG